MTRMHAMKRRSVGRKGRLLLRGILMGSAAVPAVTACEDTPSSPGTGTPVAAMEVVPEEFDLEVGETLDLHALAFSADGSPLPDRPLTWSTQYAGVATVSPGGRVRAVGAGIAEIYAKSGGVTATATVTVRDPEAPTPTIASLDPASVEVGSAAFELTVIGTGFVPGARALWGGEARHTTWLSPTRLRVQIRRTDVVEAGAVDLVVENAPFGGAASEPVPFTITPAGSGAPVLISSFDPASVPAGSVGFTLTARGQGFRHGATVLWNDSPRVTTVVGPNEVRVDVAAQDVWEAGAQEVVVVSPETLRSPPTAYPVAPSGVAAVAVSPHELVVDKGHAGQLLARPLALDLTPLEGRHVVWSSTNGNVVQVDGDGSYRATGAGPAKIRAQTADAWSEIDVLVRPLPVGLVMVSPAASALLVGGSELLQARVFDAGGDELVGHPVTWSSDDLGVATVDAEGRATGRSKGRTRIRAYAGGRTGQAVVEVRQWPTGDVWTMDLRWPDATVFPTVGDTTWVDDGGTARSGAVMFTGSTLVMDRAAGTYTQRFDLHVVGLGGVVREESGTAGLDWGTGGFIFRPEAGGAEQTFTAQPSGPAELRVSQAVGSAPQMDYRYVVR